MDYIRCITSRLLHAARRQAGVTLIETVFAIAIFGIVSTSMISVLTSATAADGLSRQRSIALELAQQQVEFVRQLGYGDVCISGGNPSCPSGVVGVTPTLQKRVMGLWYQLKTSIRWVNDAVATGVATGANYKRVRVTVSRLNDNKQLAQVYSFVANPSNKGVGGINNAIINVTVLDYGCNTGDGCTTNSNPVYLQGAQVDLWDGPSTHSSDVTDETGTVTFASVAPNPADSNGVLLPSGATAYYDILAGLSNYTTLREDLPPGTVPNGTGAAPASATHLQLNPGQTQSVNVRLYRAAMITVVLNNASGNPYTSPAYIDIGATYPRCAQEFSTSAGSFIVGPTSTIGSTETALCPGGEQPVSGTSYSVGARSADGTLVAAAVKKTVPNNYPMDLNSTFTLTLQPVTTNSCTVTVKKGTTTIPNARVDITNTTGSPVQPYATGVTNGAGVAVFNSPATTISLPVTGGYSINAWGTLSGSAVSGGLSSVSVPSSGCSFTVPVS